MTLPAFIPARPSLTIIESPFAGDIEANLCYARQAMLDSIRRGECPFASHLLYPQVLNDADPSERELGLKLAEKFYRHAAQVVVYDDFGISPGMARGIAYAQSLALPIHHRTLWPVKAAKKIDTITPPVD